MREVQSLRRAAGSAEMPESPRPAWGNSQRFLVAGLAVFLLAAIAAVILYIQFPPHFAGLRSPDDERKLVERMSTLETMRYFQQWILPGIDIPEQGGFQSTRSMVYLGMATLAGLGAIGLVLVGIGVAGIVRRR